jgi:hypothetical protein
MSKSRRILPPSERPYLNFDGGCKLTLSDRVVGATSTNGDHTNGKHGIAKDRRGAKKYIRTRIRFHENAATRKMLKDAEFAIHDI